MIDAATLKALASTVLTFAVVIGAGTVTKALGQQSAADIRVPAANPYETVDSVSARADHNRVDAPVPASPAGHNLP